MRKRLKVLLIGESWMVHMVETKGFDTFSIDYYEEGTRYIKAALGGEEFEFSHMPCHRIEYDFPRQLEGLQNYDVIIISDVGANTFLLPVETFLQSKQTINKLQLLKEYVLSGGGLCMVGGYLSFMGIEGKGKYKNTAVEDVLPVTFLRGDDRQEHPEGIQIVLDHRNSPILQNLPDKLTGFLGYNKALIKEGCEAVAVYGSDPFIATGEFGKGRSVAYASDLAPHWSPKEFCLSDEYRTLWQNIVKWLAKQL